MRRFETPLQAHQCERRRGGGAALVAAVERGALALDAERETYAGVVALGCVVRGETSHYDIVSGESARALMDIGMARGIPVGNGILTVDTIDQARKRAALDSGDKGGTAAAAALALVRLKRRLKTPHKLR